MAQISILQLNHDFAPGYDSDDFGLAIGRYCRLLDTDFLPEGVHLIETHHSDDKSKIMLQWQQDQDIINALKERIDACNERIMQLEDLLEESEKRTNWLEVEVEAALWRNED